MTERLTISAAVEGVTDEAVVRKLISHVGAEPGPVYGKRGKSHLKEHISGFNNAARHSPWIVVVDLDHDAACAPPLCARWIPTPAPRLCFRVAVHSVEAWLIADAVALSDFLGIALKRIPVDPDALLAPKQILVNLARASRRKAIRQDMVPRPGSGRQIGPAYTSRLIEFVSSAWRPAEAEKHSDSLRRAIACLALLSRSA